MAVLLPGDYHNCRGRTEKREWGAVEGSGGKGEKWEVGEKVTEVKLGSRDGMDMKSKVLGRKRRLREGWKTETEEWMAEWRDKERV